MTEIEIAKEFFNQWKTDDGIGLWDYQCAHSDFKLPKGYRFYELKRGYKNYERIR